MFGGALANGQLLLDTFVFNGTNWSQVSVANGAGPSARIQHMMASSTTEVLLFGGSNYNSQLFDTWKYTASSGWQQLSPTNSPSVRSNGSLSYDSGTGTYVLFGGQNVENFLPQTWTYTIGSNNWVQRATATSAVSPPGLIGAQMSYDTGTAATILFGGISATTDLPSNSTWSFSTVSMTWTQLG